MKEIVCRICYPYYICKIPWQGIGYRIEISGETKVIANEYCDIRRRELEKPRETSEIEDQLSGMYLGT